MTAAPQRAPAAAAGLAISETRLLVLVALVQFVNILDFMMVMPLGPDFATALGVPVSRLGLVGGAYTAAAAVAGVLSSRFLDRFDRRPALAVSMLGLVLGTAAGGFAQGLPSLMLARVLAGAFGGPATSLSLSIIADVIPPARRGRALGQVMGAFSVASVLGVPAGLELARLGGWRLPFFAVAGLGAVVAAASIFMMPSLRLHLASDHRAATRSSLFSYLRERTVLLSLLGTFSVMVAAFSLIPNIATYVQHNLGYPREHLGVLYLAGGATSFFVMRLIGRHVDGSGAPLVSALGTALFVLVVAMTFIFAPHWVPVPVVFMLFMTSMAIRGVSLNALTSRVPMPAERARFMSLQSATQHVASSIGAVLSAGMLREAADHSLLGMGRVAALSIVLACALPLVLARVEHRVRLREASAQV